VRLGKQRLADREARRMERRQGLQFRRARPSGFIRLPERAPIWTFGGVKKNRLFMASSHLLYALYGGGEGRRLKPLSCGAEDPGPQVIHLGRAVRQGRDGDSGRWPLKSLASDPTAGHLAGMPGAGI